MVKPTTENRNTRERTVIKMFVKLKDSYVDLGKVKEIYKGGGSTGWGNAIGFLFDDNTRINVNYSNAKERDEDFENIFKKHLTNNT